MLLEPDTTDESNESDTTTSGILGEIEREFEQFEGPETGESGGILSDIESEFEEL